MKSSASSSRTRSTPSSRFTSVTERYIGALAKVEDEYLRERATDMRDVSGRVIE
jgi:phosphoenolpyruvate-protein kinase (PTS system EI component)